MPINFLRKIIQEQDNPSDGFWMKRAPSICCANYIESFYLFYGIKSQTEQWIFNDGFPSMIVFPEKCNQVSINMDGKENIIQSGWFDAGVIKRVYIKYLENLDYILIVRFKPEYFHGLFNLPPSFFKNQNIVKFTEVDSVCIWSDKIFATNSIEKRINIIEELIETLSPADTSRGLLNSAIELINQNNGQILVADLVRKIGVNYKWLERNFSRHIGLTPKEYIQLQRFISAYINLYSKSYDLLSVAVDNGYYDYNHFLKEFKDFTGSTPLKFIDK